MTLTELMVGVAIGVAVMAGLLALFISGLFNFAGLGNYAALTGQSRLSLDLMSREIRQATEVVSFQTNASGKSLTLTNAFKGISVTYSWDAATAVLTCDKTGEARRVCLTGCDAWDFSFYQRAPRLNYTFYPTENLSLCKLLNMSWKCSRTILNKKINTEYIVTAQVVLRNKS